MTVERNIIIPGTASGDIAIWDHPGKRWKPGKDANNPVVNVLAEGVIGDGVVDDTTLIAAAMAKATDLGLPLYFPKAPGFYRLTAALTPTDSQQLILTPGTIIEQVTKWLPVFDLLDADDVTIDGHGALLRYTGDRTYSAGTTTRGSAQYVLSAGVWSNSNRGTFRDLRMDGFTSAVALLAWNGTALEAYAHRGNVVEHIYCENVDFGLLFEGQDALVVRGLRGRTVLSLSSPNPNHLIYSSSGGRSRQVSISDCEEWSDPASPTLYAFQFKAIDGGTISNLTARGTNGVISCGGGGGAYNTDLTITNVVARDQTPNTSGLVFMQGSDLRVTIDHVALHAADGVASDRALRVDGVDCRISDVTIRARHSANAVTHDVTVQGTRNVLDGVTILNLQDNGTDYTTGWRGISVGASTDCVIRPRILRNLWQYGVEIAASATTPRLDLTHAKITFVAGGTITPVMNASTTALLFTDPGVFNVKAYGAVGDGVINDVAAIQRAIDACGAAGGGEVFFPTGSYKANTAIQLKVGVFLRGVGSTPGANAITKILGTAGQNVIELPASGANVGFGVENLIINGGLNGIYVPAGGGGPSEYNTYLRLRDLHIQSASQSCIEVLSRIEEWDLDKVTLFGGQYGFRYNGPRIDKCTFTNVVTQSQTLNGWHITATEASQNVTWINMIMHTAGQHGFVVGASVANRNWVFINPYAEGTGQTGKSTRTTGSITTGTAALTVASGTGLVNGDPIVVAGAGASGIDLFTTISSGGGTTSLTLAANAATTVTAANVTNGSYDDFAFPASTNTGDVTFLGGYLGSEGTGGHVRYAIDARSLVQALVLINLTNLQPVYDPLRLGQVFGGASVRQPNNFTGYNLHSATIAGFRQANELVRTLIPSPPGRNTVLALRDSLDTTAGTFGNLEVRKNNANKDSLFSVVGSDNTVYTRGRVVPNGLVGPLTLTANSTTPDVSAANSFQTANTAPTTITNFTTGVTGQTIKIRCTDANTTVANGATIKTNTAANKLLVADRVYTFTLFGTVWVENA